MPKNYELIKKGLKTSNFEIKSVPMGGGARDGCNIKAA